MTNHELLDALLALIDDGTGRPPLEMVKEMKKDAERWTCLPLLHPMDIVIEVTGATHPQDLHRGLERRVDKLINSYRSPACLPRRA